MALLNGRPDQHPLMGNRGLAYGDGVFETIAWIGGELRHWPYHLERLQNGCRRLAIPLPDADALKRECLQLVESTTPTVVKIIVTRGSGGRGYMPIDNVAPVRIVDVRDWPSEYARFAEFGIRTRCCETRLGLNPQLAGIKHLNRLEQVLASREIADGDVEEGLVCDPNGHLIGGTKTNIFLIDSGRLVTPIVDRCGVAGVMRRIVIESAQSAGLAVVEQRIPLERLDQADEVFVCNAIAGIWPVVSVSGSINRTFTIGAATRDLADRVGRA